MPLQGMLPAGDAPRRGKKVAAPMLVTVFLQKDMGYGFSENQDGRIIGMETFRSIEDSRGGLAVDRLAIGSYAVCRTRTNAVCKTAVRKTKTRFSVDGWERMVSKENRGSSAAQGALCGTVRRGRRHAAGPAAISRRSPE